MTSFSSHRCWFGRLKATHNHYTDPWFPYTPPGSFTVTAWTDEDLAQKVYEQMVRDGSSKSMRLFSHRTMRSHAFGEPWYPPEITDNRINADDFLDIIRDEQSRTGDENE